MEQYTQSTDVSIKQYTCEIDACNKRFARRDHLERHKLNHQEIRLPCPRCESQFARRDLLSKCNHFYASRNALTKML